MSEMCFDANGKPGGCSRAALEGASGIPGVNSWYPGRHVYTIFVVLRAKHFPERGLLIEFYKQNNGGHRNQQNHQRRAARFSENDPQANPAHEEAHVHRVPYIAIKPHHHQPLRRNKRRGRPAPRPAKIPDAPQRHGKAQHRRHGSNPSPARAANCRNVKCQPARQQPEPQRKERCSHGQRSNRRQPNCASRFRGRSIRHDLFSPGEV
jgi:hypothetical protein